MPNTYATNAILYDDILDNPSATRIKRLAELMKTRGRRKEGRFLIEAPQAVREALLYRPDLVQDLYIEVDGDGVPVSERAAQMQTELLAGSPERVADGQRRVFIHHVSSRVMNAVTGDAQGILAVAAMGDLVRSLADFHIKEQESQGGADTQPDRGLVAAFWQVRDPGNAGTVIRSCDAAGASAVVFVDDCVTPFSPKVVRATAGSLFHIPMLRASVDEWFDWCSEQSLPVIAADVYGTEARRPVALPDVLRQAHADDNAIDAEAPSRAVLFGNEARGLEPEVIDRCGQVVSIPIYGKAESLNLATSASVLLYSLAMATR